MSELSAPVFNIVHGSAVDGYGVRTTVFLKGCPLHCLWCCNPEGQKKEIELKYTAQDCNGCGDCISVCPHKAIVMVGEQEPKIAVDRNLCDNCMICADICFSHSLVPFAKLYTVDELFREIEKDQGYFGMDGGVTIGGGEATFHPEYTLAFIQKCKKSYIHTALDTCGYIESETGLRCLAEADLVLYDIKGMDPVKHKAGTGVDNDLILKNLEYRNRLGKDIIIRLPLIPEYTDTHENLEREIDLLLGMESVKRVDLIPFHKYSQVKYHQLGWSLPCIFDKDFPQEKEKEILDLFLKSGINAQIGG